MAPVARELAARRGVLEPLQTADSIDGQIAELQTILERSAERPVDLLGFSWGAMLAFMYAARHPGDVRKLILIASGSFEDGCAERILPDRMSRLTEAEARELETLMDRLDDPAEDGKDRALARLGEIMARADAFRPGPPADVPLDVSFHIYQRVWAEARTLRSDGRLLALGASIRCPVVAIHGDHDPHPASGVRIPLARVARDFRFILLEKCGHRPWIELEARDAFFALLELELSPPR
jgi:pimeloyl-ACP methyl ester carboxylesterase